MVKRTSTVLLSMVLALILVFTFISPAFAAAGGPYRVVLRYYDSIQITFDVKYPAGYDRDEWTGPMDVPIGGIGVPGTGPYDISEYLASQIYCVDPFTAFHSNVPGLGGSFINQNTDIVTGYVEAAPWIMSGAMQRYGDAVAWIATNGYRGVYQYSQPDGDLESQASIIRLRTMFNDKPWAVNIDREIAVMATKVAIWKIIAGDNVQIVKTTLDNRTNPDSTTKRATFDALVEALVDEALKVLLPGTKPLKPGEIATVTSFNVVIDDSAASYDEGTGTTYNFYGPMTVEATLDNTTTLPDLEKVFLAASGPSLDGFMFVSAKSPSAVPTNRLLEDTLFGTTRDEQYIGGSVTGSTWISDPFYLAIPKSRVPLRGDQLLVQAMAMAPSVTVVEGTPVVFAFSENGVQDWDMIQAFIGGVQGGQQVNLFAEARWYTGTTSLGELYISKQVENATILDIDQTFTFAVYYDVDEHASPSFTTAKRLDLTDFPVRGAFSIDTANNTFTLKNSGLALIKGLPMVVYSGEADNIGGPEYEYYYWIEEIGISSQDYDTPNLEISIGKDEYSEDGFLIGPFRLDDDEYIEAGFVTVTNTRKVAGLTITKTVEEGISSDTLFDFVIYFNTSNGYQPVPLTPTPGGPEFYLSIKDANDAPVSTTGRIKTISLEGAGGTTLSGPYGLQLKDGETATVENLPTGNYRVQEQTTSYDTTYSIAGSASQSGVYASFVLTDGTQVDFTNKTKPQIPATGDNSNVFAWAIIGALSILSLSCISVYRKRRSFATIR